MSILCLEYTHLLYTLTDIVYIYCLDVVSKKYALESY